MLNAYVTISLLPNMVYKIRKGLQQAIENPTSTAYIKGMVMVLNAHFGQGANGTVATSWHQEISHGDQHVGTDGFLLGS